MALWMVRAGSSGEREKFAIDKNCVVIGWDRIPDMGPLSDKDAMTEAYKSSHPAEKLGTIANAVGQLRSFAHRIQKGDLVVLPLKTRAALAVGTVTGPYEFHKDGPEGAVHVDRWQAVGIQTLRRILRACGPSLFCLAPSASRSRLSRFQQRWSL